MFLRCYYYVYPYLFNRLESEGVGLKLVGEAGGLGAELLGYVPHIRRELDQRRH